MSDSVVEAPADPPGYRKAKIALIVGGLVFLVLVVGGAIFLFGPDASAAGSCGGG
ncbi:MAG TPA: hypothetical protein VGJ28_18795 [Micromonosporaceae bacterium]|jgi:hypothetical protein